MVQAELAKLPGFKLEGTTDAPLNEAPKKRR